MKNITKLILGMLVFSFNLSQAQVALNEVNVQSNNKNAVAKPNEETPKTAFVEVRYYYYPNLQAYFDTKVAMYLYKEDGQWVESEKIAPTLMGYSLKNGQYVMLEGYTGEEPYELIEEHKAKYPADFSSRPKRDMAAN